jgi:CHAT domain-containing protein/tetratricopeptide (TPR) repeat protein
MKGNRFANIMLTALMLFAISAAPRPAAAQDMREITDTFNRMRRLSGMGDYEGALTQAEKFEADIEARFGVNHPNYAAALNALAICYGNLGRYADSEALFRQVLAIREKGRDTDSIAESLNNLAVVLVKEGKYGPAEDLYKRSLALDEKHHNGISGTNTLGSLANFYRRQGRYADAEGLYLRVLAFAQKTRGPDNLDVAVALDELALLYIDQGRYGEAERLTERALAIKQKSTATNAQNIAASRILLAKIYRGQGKYAESGELFKAALTFEEQAYGSNHPDLAETLADLALVDQAQRRYDEAEQLLLRALTIHRQVEGRSHPATAKALNQLAVLSGLAGKTAQALSYSRQTTAAVIALATSASTETQQGTTSLNLIEQRASFFRTHVADLAAAAATGIEPQAALGSEGFEIAQWAIQSTAGAAVQQMGARFAAGDGALAALVRQSQDLSALWHDRDKTLVEALGRPQAQRNQAMIDTTRRQIADIEGKLAEVTTRLRRDFPGYAALASPTPLKVADAQKLLGADEALVFFLTNDNESYVFALTRDAFDWKTIPVGGMALQEKVASFRRGLNPDTLGQQIEAAKSTGKPPDMFDLGLANALYVALLGPVETLTKDKKQLLIVPSGALTALPFNLLVTDKPSGAASSLATPAAYRNAAWLIKRQAVTVIPSVVSLNALRAFARKDVAGKPMVGFGDPQFNPNAAGGTVQVAARSLTTRSYTDFFAGVGVDRAKLAQALPALPDTADELKAVAKDLGVPTSDIHLGKDASETTVKRLPLADYRIIYFATHGLVAGDIKGLAEPSLALSIPPQPTDLDDGLLTASEVTQLKLNANWVVLSACNTIAGDKPGAEALSGLARAFFYAGARALLVSHWSVDSNAATRLTTSTFDLLKSDSSLGRAEALRRAELAYLSDPSDPMNSYPAFWGPFEIVGEGAAR